MKRTLQFRIFSLLIIASMSMGIMAQSDIIFDPATLIPADTGYYIGGIWLDENNDGTPEFYNQCLDFYGDASHNESGVQQGFTYNECMIMPTCWPKNAVEDPLMAEIDHPEGYIELTKSKYSGTDSAHMGYIVSPLIENLVSLYMELSPDVSSNDSRKIKYWVEYSLDRGLTWENSFIENETVSKAGDSIRYDGSVYLEFNDMITASKSGPIVLRIFSKPEISGTYQPQRVKIHWLKIVADLSTVSIENQISNPTQIRVFERTISAIDDRVLVFNITGQQIGRGESVTVREQGIYIVRTESGNVHKIFVK